MANLDEKLQHINKIVQEAADKQKKAMLDEKQEELLKISKEKELEVLAESKALVQDKIDELKNLLGKSMLNEQTSAKQGLLKLRDSIANETFELVLKKLEEFKNSTDYVKYLLDTAKNAAEKLNWKNYTVYIDKSDEKYSDKLKNELKSEVKVYDDNIIGGVILFQDNMLANCSFATALDEQRQAFLKISGLSI